MERVHAKVGIALHAILPPPPSVLFLFEKYNLIEEEARSTRHMLHEGTRDHVFVSVLLVPVAVIHGKFELLKVSVAS